MNANKIILIILILTFTTSFIACKKCESCIAVTITEYDAAMNMENDTITEHLGELCDEDLKEVDGLKINNTNTNGSGYIEKTYTSYTCN